MWQGKNLKHLPYDDEILGTNHNHQIEVKIISSHYAELEWQPYFNSQLRIFYRLYLHGANSVFTNDIKDKNMFFIVFKYSYACIFMDGMQKYSFSFDIIIFIYNDWFIHSRDKIYSFLVYYEAYSMCRTNCEQYIKRAFHDNKVLEN